MINDVEIFEIKDELASINEGMNFADSGSCTSSVAPVLLTGESQKS